MSDRYQRHRLIDWFDQETIQAKEVAIIGVGAVGNEVLKSLALLGVRRISVFDLDRIEEHNLTRSVLFRPSDVGLAKAVVAAERAMELDPEIKVTPLFGDFWRLASVSDFQRFDVVFCCVDNFEARIHANMLSKLSRTNLVNVGIDARNAVVELFPFAESPDCACYECALPETVYSRMAERYSCGHLRKVSFIEKKIPTTIITSSVAAALAVSVGLRLGSSEPTVRSLRFFMDTISAKMTTAEVQPTSLCPCCGRTKTIAAHVVCRPDIESMPITQTNPTIFASEPILVGYTYDGQETVVFQRASDYDTSFLANVATNPDKVSVVIRDQFELQELQQKFAHHQMPCKFVIASDGQTNILLELEEA